MIVTVDKLIKELQNLPNPATHQSTVYTLIMVDSLTLEVNEVDLMAMRTAHGWAWCIKLNER